MNYGFIKRYTSIIQLLVNSFITYFLTTAKQFHERVCEYVCFSFQVRYEESELEFEDEVDLLMSSDIVSAQISTKPITFTKVQSGWFFKEDRK